MNTCVALALALLATAVLLCLCWCEGAGSTDSFATEGVHAKACPADMRMADKTSLKNKRLSDSMRLHTADLPAAHAASRNAHCSVCEMTDENDPHSSTETKKQNCRSKLNELKLQNHSRLLKESTHNNANILNAVQNAPIIKPAVSNDSNRNTTQDIQLSLQQSEITRLKKQFRELKAELNKGSN